MSYRKIEAQSHSAEQVQQYLDTALRLTAELDVPEDLRVAFFNAAVQLVSAKLQAFDQVGGVIANAAALRG